MRSSSKFANRVLGIVSVSKMPAGLWSKLCMSVIEPVLEDLSSNSRTVEIDGERVDAYSAHMPIGEAEDEFASKVTPEVAFELYMAQREYNHIVAMYDRALAEPPVEMPEEIAKRLVEGITQVDELRKFLVVADAFVEIAEDFYKKNVDDIYIEGLLIIAMDIYAHYMLLAPLDIDNSISMCGGMLKHCTDQREKVTKILDEIHGFTPGESDEESEAKEFEAEESETEGAAEEVSESEESIAEESAEVTDEAAEGSEEAETESDEQVAEESAEEPQEAPEEPVETSEEPASESIDTAPQEASAWAEQAEDAATSEDDEFQFVGEPGTPVTATETNDSGF